MPRYVSKDGIWFPAKEKVSLVNRSSEVKEINGQKVEPGDPFIYDGEDRAALFELHKAGEETFGEDFRQNTEVIQAARNLGFKNVDEYAKARGYNRKEVEDNFEKNAAVVTKHELPAKVEAIETLGGGRDFSGQGKNRYGGFGDPGDLSS